MRYGYKREIDIAVRRLKRASVNLREALEAFPYGEVILGRMDDERAKSFALNTWQAVCEEWANVRRMFSEEELAELQEIQ